jgi:hypothetical protein
MTDNPSVSYPSLLVCLSPLPLFLVSPAISQPACLSVSVISICLPSSICFTRLTYLTFSTISVISLPLSGLLYQSCCLSVSTVSTYYLPSSILFTRLAYLTVSASSLYLSSPFLLPILLSVCLNCLYLLSPILPFSIWFIRLVHLTVPTTSFCHPPPSICFTRPACLSVSTGSISHFPSVLVNRTRPLRGLLFCKEAVCGWTLNGFFLRPPPHPLLAQLDRTSQNDTPSQKSMYKPSF